jgi:hypothetical protein
LWVHHWNVSRVIQHSCWVSFWCFRINSRHHLRGHVHWHLRVLLWRLRRKELRMLIKVQEVVVITSILFTLISLTAIETLFHLDFFIGIKYWRLLSYFTAIDLQVHPRNQTVRHCLEHCIEYLTFGKHMELNYFPACSKPSLNCSAETASIQFMLDSSEHCHPNHHLYCCQMSFVSL